MVMEMLLITFGLSVEQTREKRLRQRDRGSEQAEAFKTGGL